MRFVRARARLAAAMLLTWHAMAFAAIPAMCCDGRSGAAAGAASEHAGMADCPMHDEQRQTPSCPLHSDKQASHECNCPTIGCADPAPGLVALLGIAGVIPTVAAIHVPLVDVGTAPMSSPFTTRVASPPLSPPPRV